MTQAAFLFHDIAEPVFQDFTPGQIEKKDKQKLEAICIELLTEGRLTGDLQAQHVYNCFLIFEGASQDDFDKMQGHILASIDSSKTPLNLDQSGLSEYLKLVYNLSIDLTEVQEMLKEADVLSMLEPVVKIKLTKNYEVSEEEEAEKQFRGFIDYIDQEIKTEEGREYFKKVISVYEERLVVLHKRERFIKELPDLMLVQFNSLPKVTEEEKEANLKQYDLVKESFREKLEGLRSRFPDQVLGLGVNEISLKLSVDSPPFNSTKGFHEAVERKLRANNCLSIVSTTSGELKLLPLSMTSTQVDKSIEHLERQLCRINNYALEDLSPARLVHLFM